MPQSKRQVKISNCPICKNTNMQNGRVPHHHICGSLLLVEVELMLLFSLIEKQCTFNKLNVGFDLL